VHTYADPGHYDVSLTVTDNNGATNTKTRRADVKE
jgi:PKD repeat protein